MCIPVKRRPAAWLATRGRPLVARTEEDRRRYTVERTFARLGDYRRLLIRLERLFGVCRSFFALAALLVRTRWVSASGRPGGRHAIRT